jgi:DNA polymerase-3 subunit epsilon
MFEEPVVFVDIETTGGSYKSSRVTEVAAIRVENGEVTDEFSTLVNPQTYIPRAITALTGITDEDVASAPTFDEIADRFAEICDGAVFVAHNVRFDYSFLKAELAAVGVVFQPKLLCTIRLSRALYSEVKGHSLAALIERHNIPFQHRHRALDDARAIHLFSTFAYNEHGEPAFREAVAKQLRSQSLPPNLAQKELADVGNGPGVYIFEDEHHQPLYVGKSVTLKTRVMSHFSDTTSSKELKISQLVHHIRTIPTANELAALILESKLVKQLQPIFNRQLRRVSSYAMFVKSSDGEYATINVVSGRPAEQAPLETVYGLYETRTKAKHRLDEMTRTFSLCPKLMGLEKTQPRSRDKKQPCFSYQLGKCKGACIGNEDPVRYNQRFETALMHSKLDAWPYGSAVAVPIGSEGSGVLIDQWIVQGFYSSETAHELETIESNFDVDEYKIIRRFLRENQEHIIPASKLLYNV